MAGSGGGAQVQFRADDRATICRLAEGDILNGYTYWLANVFRAVLVVMSVLTAIIALSELYLIFHDGWVHILFFLGGTVLAVVFLAIATLCDKVMVKIAGSSEK
ncbi:hypothetical protein [Caulobacter sp. LARHSG274]